MQFRLDNKSGSSLSILGYGCMRLPRSRGRIDLAKSEALILSALERGVNYFDTAYVYTGSEEALGTIISKNSLRDRIFLATKLPQFMCRKTADFDKLFAEQLTRLQTSYFDYYLIHNLQDLAQWQRLLDLGIENWIKQKKASGEIKQIGFSFHGSQMEFCAILDAYDWEFCQIQYNYVNINYQAGQLGLKKAAEKGLPVIIMEPLLGGKLATGLSDKALDIFAAADDTLTPAQWGLKWLWDQPEVTVVLSGMNEQAQLDENIKAADLSSVCGLSDADHAMYGEVIEVFNSTNKISCTGCSYCMPCPHGVNIPGCFAAYNSSFAQGKWSGIQSYIMNTGILSHAANKCKECGACEKHCPQHIPIVMALGDVRKRLEPFWLKAGISVYNVFRGERG